MALPVSWNLVPVTATYLRLDTGAPCSGNVTFTATQVNVSESKIVMPRVITAELDENGSISVELPSTDDPDLLTQGWTYEVQENLSGTSRPPYSIEVPYNGGPINLADVAPVTPPTGGEAGVPGPSGRIPLVRAIVSTANLVPTFDDDLVKVTAQGEGLSIDNPTGTPIDGLGIVLRIKDDGTARAITYGDQYRAIEVSLPATTVVGKTTYIAMLYNSDDTKFDVVAAGTEA